MKFCPNPSCAYAVKYGRALEYRSDISVCAECGATLSEHAPKTGAVTSARMPNDAAKRLGGTVAAAVLIALGKYLPFFGIVSSVASRGAAQGSVGVEGIDAFSLLTFGVTPFVSAFVLVECFALLVPSLRAVRMGGEAARRGLRSAAFVLGAGLLVVQLFGSLRFLESLQGEFGQLPSNLFIAAQWLVAHVALLALVLWVTKHGLVNGFSMVMLIDAGKTVVDASSKLLVAMREAESVTLGQVLLVVTVIALVVVGAVKVASATRPTGESSVPSMVPFPVSGFVPLTAASIVLSLPMTLEPLLQTGGALVHWLQRSQVVYFSVTGFVVIDAALIFGWLFFRPVAVGRLWAKWVAGVDEIAVVARARTLLPRALVLAGAGLLVMTLLGPVISNVINLNVSPGLIQVLWVTFILLDLREEWAARERLGLVVSVASLQRTAEVEPVAHVLRRAGIPFHVRSLAYRTVLQFFGPYVPIEFLVPVARVDEARAMLGE